MNRPKILIVEDEFMIAFQLKTQLCRDGYEVCCQVASGEEAIEATKRENPDFVLMDINLRGKMDGIEAARDIGLFSSAKIIFTTGYGDSSLRERAMILCPAAYLSKPIEMGNLKTYLDN